MAVTTAPFTLAAVKTFLRVDHSDEDDTISQLMIAATDYAENFLRRTCITRTRYHYLDAFPTIIRPPYSPLVAITSIQYYDTNGDLQTLDSSYYRVDTNSEPGRITESYGYSWPSTREQTGAVIVTYTSGYGALAANVPDDLIIEIMGIVQYLYERDGRIELLDQAKGLLTMKRIYSL